MSDYNDAMLVLAALMIALFVGFFIFFRVRYRVEPVLPVAPAAPAPVRRPLPAYLPWRLMARSHINPGSARRAAWRLRFEPEGAMPQWRPGATVQVYPGPPEDGLDLARPVRDYPVASLPGEGAIEIIVRDEADGSADWLCNALDTGQRAALALYANPEFAPPGDDTPLILIGNGVGIGGLRAYIRARPPGSRNWLMFGEHASAFDMLLGPEIADWVATGHLERCDLVFARDGAAKEYVSDRIHAAAGPLFDWVLADAAVYVCGRSGFAGDVDRALAEVLGADVLEELKPAGLYRQQTY